MMRIYDDKTPEGRKVEKPGTRYCVLCQGRDGRHGLVSVTRIRTKANGHRQTLKGTDKCPNGQVDTGVDAA